MNEIDFLTCVVCLDVFSDAVEVNCCHNLLCFDCFVSCSTKCAHCRHPKPSASPNVPVRKMVGSLSTKCEFCKCKTTRGELKKHHLVCSEKTFQCSVCNLFFTTFNSLKEHVIVQHPQEFVERFSLADDVARYIKVVMINDDTTTFDFVILVLNVVFNVPPRKGVELAHKIHNEGKADIAIYPAEEALQYVKILDRFAEMCGFPLRVLCEYVSSSTPL
ncbi:hypothetical protein RCL1_005876 [Eukaryota sp. TZLM3-RCL]